MKSEASPDMAVELREVSCELGGKQVLDRIDLQLNRGEIVAVLGASGAGKSTLLRAIAGFEAVSGGEIRSGDEILSSPQISVAPENRKIGIVVQNFALFPHLTARKNIEFALDRANRTEIARSWLQRVELANREDAYPHELSGGEQQRIALARAMARDPEIVLLDEAFSSLDQQLRQSVRDQTKQLLRASGAAVLAVTHDPEEAMDLADRIVILSDGRVLQQGTPQEVYWRPVSVTAGRLLGDLNVLQGEVRAGQLCTAFGELPAGNLKDGTSAMALIRPAAIRFREDDQGPVTVTDANFSGGQYRLNVESEDGERLELLHHALAAPTSGTRGALEFDVERLSIALA